MPSTRAESGLDQELVWHDAMGVADLWEGDLTDLEIEGEEVLLVHLDGGGFRAFQGMCPHQEIPLADGDFDEETSVLTCSGHLWQFDLSSGDGVNPSGCRLFQFPVEVVEDRVRIGVPQDGQRHYNRCRES